MPIVAEAEVEALLPAGTDIPTGWFDAVEPLVAAMIDTALGRRAEGGTELVETVTMRAGLASESIRLSRWPVTAVASVTEDGTSLAAGTAYTVDLPAGIVHRIYDANGVPIFWKTAVPLVVTYTPATLPVAKAVAAQAIARAWRNLDPVASGAKPAVMSGLRQLTIGRWSATAETSAKSTGEAIHLTDSELDLLYAHRDRSP